MGSQQSHEKGATDAGSGVNTPRGGSRRGTVTVPRSDSGSDIQESQSSTSMVPVEKLAKVSEDNNVSFQTWFYYLLAWQGHLVCLF